MIITIDDVRAVHCSHGSRAWFRSHDLDFKAFLRDGIDAETFILRGDGLSAAVVRMRLMESVGLSSVMLTRPALEGIANARDITRWCGTQGVDEGLLDDNGVPADRLIGANDPRLDLLILRELDRESADGE